MSIINNYVHIMYFESIPSTICVNTYVNAIYLYFTINRFKEAPTNSAAEKVVDNVRKKPFFPYQTPSPRIKRFFPKIVHSYLSSILCQLCFSI